MTRIIGGAAGGRRLHTPPGDRTRPTSDRVREAMFSAIESWCGSLTGLAFLDLYAGSGAVGLEAWSRGAERITLVESDRRTAEVVRRNARELDTCGVTVLAQPVAAVLRGASDTAYDIVFADPPYPLGDDDVAADLAALVTGQWLAPGAMVIVERSSRSPEPAWPEGIDGTRSKKYGETLLWYGRAT